MTTLIEEILGKPLHEISEKELEELVGKTTPVGQCRCGCGGKTTLYKGKYREYIHGHNSYGTTNPNSSGGKYTSGKLTFILSPNHPHANCRGYVQESIFKASKALGKPLPDGVQVHHVDGNSLNNDNNNLVVCESQAYHQYLHYRKKALDATGDANSKYCVICKTWSPPDDTDIYVMIPKNDGPIKMRCWHRSCRNKQDYKAGRRGSGAEYKEVDIDDYE